MGSSFCQDFLTSMADVTHWDFEIWEGLEPVFCTAHSQPRLTEREALVSKVLAERMFQQMNAGEGRLLAGTPFGYQVGHSGALIAWNNHSPDVTPPDGEKMETFLCRLTEALQTTLTAARELEKISEELGQSFEELYLYARISGWVKTMRFSTSLLEELIGQVLNTLGVDLVFARLEGRGGGATLIKTSELANGITDRECFIDGLVSAIPPDTTSLNDRYFVANDSRQVPGYAELHGEPFRALLVMIQSNENFYGWFGIASFDLKKIFHRSELRILISIAEQVAVVIANTDLYRDMEQFVIDMVKSLVYAIEAKDLYTRGHSERVNSYSMLMAERLGLEDQQKAYLNWAAILHDVGKIGIAEEILNKRAGLTAEEYELIKAHPAKGYTILQPLEPLTGSLPGIVHHHEHYDGGGYPDGLREKEIPLLARIIAVADTFDALNSDRAYRLGRPSPEALGIVQSLAGKELDPELVRVLAEVIAQKEGLGGKGGITA